MCVKCYETMGNDVKIEHIKEFDKIDNNYDFRQWNSTSLSFLYLFICDDSLKCFHKNIERVYHIINNNKNDILGSISANSIESSVHEIFNLIENKIISK